MLEIASGRGISGMRQTVTLLKNLSYPVATIVVLILAWEAATRVLDVQPYILPAPTAVGVVLWSRFDFILYHTWTTLAEILIGFCLSVVGGIFVAVCIWSSRAFERMVYPILVTSQAVPKVAIAPLFIVWLGFGWTPKILVAFLIAFFPMVIDTVTGLRSAPQEMHQLARSMGASWWQLFTKFVLPNSLPHVFAGLKVAITLAVSGAIIGEFVGADRGLGYLLLFANGHMETDLLFAGIVMLAAVGVLLFYAILGAERLVMPWRHETGGVQTPTASM